MLLVRKKNGQEVLFDRDKIVNALKLTSRRLGNSYSDEELYDVAKEVEYQLTQVGDTVPVATIHSLVSKTLGKMGYTSLGKQYAWYRDYKTRFFKAFSHMSEDSQRIIFSGDKENAHKDSSILSTQKELLAGQLGHAIMTECELNPDAVRRHNEGLIHIHDLRDRFLFGINCNLFSMRNVLKGGFTTRGVNLGEPKRIETAGSIVSNVISDASACQYGGFTVPEVDKLFSPYVRKSFEEEKKFYSKLGIKGEQLDSVVKETVWSKLLQTMESLEYELNLVPTANGQTTFVTFTFGLDTTEEGRMVSEAILKTRLAKMGTNRVTAIFPKLVFLHRKEINGTPESPNYRVKKLAVECSSKNLYPDWLSLDSGYLGEVYDRCGKAISPMGCRAFLSPYVDPETGEEVYEGRFNIGAVTMNLPRLALESNGDFDKFVELLYENMDVAVDIHEYTYEKMKKRKASSNPLFFTQGGCYVKLKPEDTIEEALKVATASFGYIGLTETCQILSGNPLHKSMELGITILKLIKNRINEYSKRYGRLYAMYATPAESLCRRFLEVDRAKFGLVEGVTDKEWYTNSHHIGVEYNLSALDKIDLESELFEIPTGGRIMYTEWPHTDNLEAMESVIDYAMEKGLYFGINLENSVCGDCGAEGEFPDGVCTECGSHNVTTYDRVCGYLGISRQNGDTRYNEGKVNEVRQRVKHYNVKLSTMETGLLKVK